MPPHIARALPVCSHKPNLGLIADDWMIVYSTVSLVVVLLVLALAGITLVTDADDLIKESMKDQHGLLVPEISALSLACVLFLFGWLIYGLVLFAEVSRSTHSFPDIYLITSCLCACRCG